jgi:hypothetical protein
MSSKSAVGRVLIAWWLVLLVIIGLGANAVFFYKSVEAGSIAGAVLFGAMLCGAAFYIFRTFRARHEIHGMLKD